MRGSQGRSVLAREAPFGLSAGTRGPPGTLEVVYGGNVRLSLGTALVVCDEGDGWRLQLSEGQPLQRES